MYSLFPQREWAEVMVKSEASTSDYWYYTGLLLAQFKGLQLGYAMASPPHQVTVYMLINPSSQWLCLLYGLSVRLFIEDQPLN